MEFQSFIKNPCNIYFSLWCVYLLQGTLYASGSFISQSLLAVILFISFVDMLKVVTSNGFPLFFRGLNYLLLLFTIYGLILILTDGAVVQTKHGFTPPTIGYLRSLYYSILPIYTCYYYTQKGYLTSRLFQKWVILFLVIAVVEFFRIKREEVSLIFDAGGDRTDITNNTGYNLLLLTSCALIFRNKPFYQYIFIGVCVLFIVLSMKRGAILIMIPCLALLVKEKLKISNKRKRWQIVLIIGVSLIGLWVFVSNFFTENEYFQNRVEETLEGKSSGRDDIYNALIHHYFYETDLFQMLFGMGADGTIKVTYKYAHNDWLEILTNQGLCGISFFIYYWAAFRITYKNKRLSEGARFALKYLFVIFFLRTFFSMSIGDMNVYSSSMLGYALFDGFKRDLSIQRNNYFLYVKNKNI